MNNSTQVVIIKTPSDDSRPAHQPETQSKPIVFVKGLAYDYTFDPAMVSDPSTFLFIELITLEYTEKFDLMFAYNNPDNRSDGILFIGHWNGGFVKPRIIN